MPDFFHCYVKRVKRSRSVIAHFCLVTIMIHDACAVFGIDHLFQWCNGWVLTNLKTLSASAVQWLAFLPFNFTRERSWVQILVSPKEYYSEYKNLIGKLFISEAYKSLGPGLNHRK